MGRKKLTDKSKTKETEVIDASVGESKFSS